MKNNSASCYSMNMWFFGDAPDYQATILSQTGRSSQILPTYDRWLALSEKLVPNSLLWVAASNKKAIWTARLPGGNRKALSLYDHLTTVMESEAFNNALPAERRQDAMAFKADIWLCKTNILSKLCEDQAALKAADTCQKYLNQIKQLDWKQDKCSSLYERYAFIYSRLKRKAESDAYLSKCESALKTVAPAKPWQLDRLEYLANLYRDLGRFPDAMRVDLYSASISPGTVRKASFLRKAASDANLCKRDDLVLEYGLKGLQNLDDLLNSDSPLLAHADMICFFDCFQQLSVTLIKQHREEEAVQLLLKWAKKIQQCAPRKYINYVICKAEARAFSGMPGQKERALHAIEMQAAFLADEAFCKDIMGLNCDDLKFDTQMDRECVFAAYHMYPQAIAAAQAALKVAEHGSPESRNHQLSDAILWMGRDYQKNGNAAEAYDCFKKLEAVWNKVGEDKYKRDYVNRLHSASVVLSEMNDYSGQERLLNICIESLRKYYGSANFPDCARFYRELEYSIVRQNKPVPAHLTKLLAEIH